VTKHNITRRHIVKKILIIDDDVDFVNAIKLLLESKNYTVISATNSEKALISIEKEKPDLIILDVMMDSPDEGFQFAYKIRSSEKFKNIPILMTTAVSQITGFKFSPKNDNIDENWIPVDEFIEKPIESEQFLKKVEHLLQK